MAVKSTRGRSSVFAGLWRVCHNADMANMNTTALLTEVARASRKVDDGNSDNYHANLVALAATGKVAQDAGVPLWEIAQAAEDQVVNGQRVA